MNNQAIFCAVICLLLSGVRSTGAVEPTVTPYSCWEVAGVPGRITWIEVHTVETIDGVEVVHGEVMARKKKAKPWDFMVVFPHLAITMDALKKSILRPIKNGSVYPETYDSGYRLWKQQADQGTVVICTTSVADAIAASKQPVTSH